MLIESVERYLQLRHTLGFDLRHTGSLLRRFARFSSTRDETHVRTRTAIDWAQRAPSPGGRDRRLKTVIRFARHVHAEDSGHEIPPDGVFGRHRQRRLPFLFTPADVSRILKQAMSLGPHGSLRPLTYYTLFALLSATGLRISEALALHLEDLTPEGLVIRKTKFRKSRLVPLHEKPASRVTWSGDETFLEAMSICLSPCADGGCAMRRSAVCSMRWWRKPGSSPVPGNGRLTSMGCATVLPSEHWKPLPATGIRSLAICWPCLRTSGMLTLPTPTGTCRSRPSC